MVAPFGTQRGRLALIPAALALLMSLVADLAAGLRVAVAGAGLVGGIAVGRLAWRQMSRRIDARNRLVVYFEDSPFFGLLVLLFILGSVPGASSRAVISMFSAPQVVTGGFLLVSFGWFGYALAVYQGVRRYECDHGAVRTRAFYARSTTGAEGLFGRDALVIADCAPSGRVRIGRELWSAESASGATIPAGQRVRVTDVEGLTLIVEAGQDDP